MEYLLKGDSLFRAPALVPNVSVGWKGLPENKHSSLLQTLENSSKLLILLVIMTNVQTMYVLTYGPGKIRYVHKAATESLSYNNANYSHKSESNITPH